MVARGSLISSSGLLVDRPATAETREWDQGPEIVRRIHSLFIDPHVQIADLGCYYRVFFPCPCCGRSFPIATPPLLFSRCSLGCECVVTLYRAVSSFSYPLRAHLPRARPWSWLGACVRSLFPQMQHIVIRRPAKRLRGGVGVLPGTFHPGTQTQGRVTPTVISRTSSRPLYHPIPATESSSLPVPAFITELWGVPGAVLGFIRSFICLSRGDVTRMVLTSAHLPSLSAALYFNARTSH